MNLLLSKSAHLGALCILIFDILCAGKAVYVGKLIQGVPSILIAFWTFGIATLLFFLLNLHRLPWLISKISANKKDVILLNAITTIVWLTYFYSLKHIEPAIYAAIAFAVGPIVTVLFWKKLRPTQPILQGEKWASLGIFFVVIFLGFTVVSGKSAFSSNLTHSILGILSSILSGISIVGVTIISKRLANEGGIDAKGIMAFRFWLFLIACLFLWPKDIPVFTLNQNIFLPICIVAILGVIIPQFVVQLGFARSEPITVALLFAITPALSYLFQLFDHRLVASPLSLIGVVASVVLTLYGIWARLGTQKKGQVVSSAPSSASPKLSTKLSGA